MAQSADRSRFGVVAGSGRVQVIFERLGSGGLSIAKDGPWARFKVLEASTAGFPSSASRGMVNFSTAGLAARYQLDASSVSNPFTREDWSRFRCPDWLSSQFKINSLFIRVPSFLKISRNSPLSLCGGCT